MKKLSPIAYRALFFKHVWRFLGNIASAEEIAGPHAVAVSGGKDSMTLLWFAKSLHDQGKIGPVRAIFVHHHTRSGQTRDAKLIEKFCKDEDIQLKILHAENLNSVESNFEARARKVRRALCLGEIKKNELLWVGHHLDDSYEWNMMQRHRSNNPKSAIGIPVRNGRIIRPFHCVTSKQIGRLRRFEGVPFREDPTNSDIKYDRNYIRLKVIVPLAEKFPGYLKFYAHLANFSAMMLKVSVITRTGASKIYVFEQGGVLEGKHFSEIQIQELLHAYSNTDRGEIVGPIQRMLKAIDNGKKGPFHFSGGMEAYASHNLLMIYHQGFKNYDEGVASILEQLSEQEILSIPHYKRIELQHAWMNLLQSTDALLNMPGLVLILEHENVAKGLNASVYDFMFPRVSEVCQRRGWRFITFTKCLEVWRSKQEKLPERLRLLPLCNLSNLFSSQQ
jgi:tRNA(Ile)-lysidine synthetase-like protein